MRKKKWIQKAITKRCGLHRQLRVPKEKRIPTILLRKIKSAKIGSTIKNPTKKGKRRIRVTRKLKKRAVLALTLRSFR